MYNSAAGKLQSSVGGFETVTINTVRIRFPKIVAGRPR